jgi:iron complex transport system substrate-binding protein
VALAPSCAEILFALGAGTRVVGVSDAARALPESRGKTPLGGFAPDLERVAALRPDLVVVSKDGTDRASFDRLSELGYRVVVTAGASLDGVLADIRAVGEAIGEKDRAETLARSLSTRIAAAEGRGRSRGTAPRVVALIWPDPPVAAGPGTFVGDLLRRAGATNAVPASAGLWPRLSIETLTGWAPEALVVPDADESRDVFRQALRAQGLSGLRAVKSGRVIRIPGDWIERPGPRLVQAFERLVERLGEK